MGAGRRGGQPSGKVPTLSCLSQRNAFQIIVAGGGTGESCKTKILNVLKNLKIAKSRKEFSVSDSVKTVVFNNYLFLHILPFEVIFYRSG